VKIRGKALVERTILQWRNTAVRKAVRKHVLNVFFVFLRNTRQVEKSFLSSVHVLGILLERIDILQAASQRVILLKCKIKTS